MVSATVAEDLNMCLEAEVQFPAETLLMFAMLGIVHEQKLLRFCFCHPIFADYWCYCC